MSSSIETIGHKLQSLEERLQAANESHDRMVYSQNLPAPAATPPAAANAGVSRPTPRLPMETTPNRPRKMFLPVISSAPAAETETDKKLKKIMKQTGILTIDGKQYHTDIKDLEHLGDLGNGTSGNVVKMRHVPSTTIIAVKQMRRTGNTEENKRILMDLDVVLKSHDCQYIVQCLGCFVRDPDVWICMELMSMCFDKLLKLSKKPVPEDILGKVTVATVKALSYLKEKHGVIHRDVKPSNILIDERGNIKLCDFGISGRLVDSKANTRSAGCAAYMAPERIDPKKPKYDIRADVWSLGITLVELATARSPYEGCNTDFEVLTKVLDSDPPSLPLDCGFHFSQEFHDFVTKCLTKNHQHRPKYPELLEQPFIKYYEIVNVDIPKWFKSVVEMAGIKTHHRTLLMSTAFDSKASKFNKYTINTISTETATTKTTATTTTTTATTSTNNSIATINAKTTQIPSYQTTSNYNRLHKPLAEQFYKTDEVPQQHQYYNPHHHHHHHHHDYHDHNHSHEYHHQHHYHKQQQQQSHLPLPVAINYNASSNFNIPTTQTNISTVTNNGGFGGSGGSSSASSSSPQSPPSTQFHLHHINESNVVADISKQYKKSAASSASASTNASVSCSSSSPFVQRKYNNGCSSYKHGESPKKDSSMFGSIGQSIIRNLTTSPFSQKKHGVGTTMTQQQQKIDAHWRMPPTNTQDVAVAYDIFDSSAPRTLATATSKIAKQQQSPMFGRNRFQSTTSAVTAQQQLIPKNNKIETNATNTQQHVQGNQSPIVLQRFYHQQNQLREREMERQQQQPHHHHLSFQQHSTDVTTTNPFLSSYIQPPSHLSHIPIASIGSSASSQSSSTQSSTNSQNASAYESSNSYHQHHQQPRSLSPQTTVTAAFGLASDEVAATGLRSLQYQPLPQQFLPLKNSLRHTASLSQQRTPPASTTPEEEYSNAFPAGIAGDCGGSGKHGKLSNRRELQAAATSSNLSGSSSGIGSGSGIGASKENSFKEHHATAMASNGTDSSKTARSGLPFYRTISAGGSNSTSPTDASPKRVSNFLDKDSCCPPATSSTPTLFKRFGVGVGAGSASSSAGHHVLAGIDRRHRSPDPPPRYNRGQSPLLLRKNLLELSGGQPPGSPLLQHRRYVTASPPLPPPRRGSESVPGSPQHFRTRIHYTPEPQRRIYRTIDQ